MTYSLNPMDEPAVLGHLGKDRAAPTPLPSLRRTLEVFESSGALPDYEWIVTDYEAHYAPLDLATWADEPWCELLLKLDK